MQMKGFPTFKGSWPWPWIESYCISSCITHRPLLTRQISWKSRKLFVGVPTYGRKDVHLRPSLLGLDSEESTQKSDRSSAIADRPARRSASVEMLSANRSRVGLRITFRNCCVLFRYLHRFVHASFNYRTASMRCHRRHQHTSIQPTLLMATGP